MNDNLKGTLLIFASILTLVFEPIFANYCYNDGMNPVSVLLFRYGSAAIILAAFFRLKKWPILLPKKHFRAALIIGLFQSTTLFLIYFAFDTVPPGMSILVINIYPLFTAVAAYFIEKERLNWVKKLSLAMALVGLVLFCWYSITFTHVNVVGIVAIFIGTLMQSVYLIYAARISKAVGASRYILNISGILAGYYLIFAIFAGGIILPPKPIDHLYMVFFTLIVTIGCTLTFYHGINIIGVVMGSIIYIAEVPLAAIAAYFVVGEVWSPIQVLGGILIVVGVLIPNLWELFLKPRYIRLQAKQAE